MDELNEYLLQNYESYITGRTDCNLLIWGSEDGAGGQTPRLCTLIVGVNFDPLHATREQMSEALNSRYRRNAHLQSMYRFGDAIASRGNVPYAVIGFPAMRDTYDNRWEESGTAYPLGEVRFYLQELPSKNRRAAAGTELRRYIYGALGEEYRDEGTAKAKNKSIADYFQFWSRSFLSRRIVKLDIDGMFYNGNTGVIIEIKRSNIPPIPDWRPYRADYPDFVLLKSFADTLGMTFTILHHTGGAPCEDGTVISLFEVESASADGIACRQETLEMPLRGPEGLNRYLERYIK